MWRTIIGLVSFAGLMAGFTLGLMSRLCRCRSSYEVRSSSESHPRLQNIPCREESASFDLYPFNRQFFGYGVSANILGQSRAILGCNIIMSDPHPHVWRDNASSSMSPLWYGSWSNVGSPRASSSMGFLPGCPSYLQVS